MTHPFLAAPLVAAAVLVAMPAGANDSTYTKIDLGDCRLFSADDMGGRWSCPGYNGIHLMVAEGDLRFFVSYGDNAFGERAAEQTFPEFNTINDTLEWRLDASGTPIATILRWFLDQGDGDQRQVLVVTKLSLGSVCHVGYVRASEPNANARARQVADTIAPSFDCGTEPGWY